MLIAYPLVSSKLPSCDSSTIRRYSNRRGINRAATVLCAPQFLTAPGAITALCSPGAAQARPISGWRPVEPLQRTAATERLAPARHGLLYIF
eukprot:scaffold50191_cov65-Phaeocystis_antarctica.AAC.5